ncbi:GNAT family N-acetyltransferase [Vagococcus bubulae]|uniref:GNAT family N-acetyltransferase n=1 Tax=Vagococcus bubulae TaxID=1977868 RepID=UPI0022E1EE3B|nr:GNAT family N-acetyltransferase [Vagococcus bubulae]
MKLVLIEEIDIPTIKHFKESFNQTHDIIHGANQLQRSKNIEKWLQDVTILKTKDYKQSVQTTHYALINQLGEMVGISDVKHHLTPYLQKEGGHISYSISPTYQGKGYGTLLLKETLKKAHTLGLKKVLLTCKETNIASKKVIENNQGIYQYTMLVNQSKVDHYLIHLDNNNYIM